MFSAIYVTSKAREYSITGKILARFSQTPVVEINHYKDVFNRRSQDFAAQKASPALILATNDSERIYPGARTCQDFGADRFYYTSLIKNCIYDCQYCYLQGMYPSANIVIFVNIEDYFEDAKKLSKEGPISLSISYDTDMLALEGITGYVGKWCDFLRENPNITAELRSKCGSLKIYEKPEKIPKNLVLAYTISPDSFAKKYEQGASSYGARREALYKALELGVTTRLCLDPIIPFANYKEVYGALIDDLFSNPLAKRVKDVSVGTFRISKEYISSMKKARPTVFSTYPYDVRDGICTYEAGLVEEILDFVTKKLVSYLPKERIFADER